MDTGWGSEVHTGHSVKSEFQMITELYFGEECSSYRLCQKLLVFTPNHRSGRPTLAAQGGGAATTPLRGAGLRVPASRPPPGPARFSDAPWRLCLQSAPQGGDQARARGWQSRAGFVIFHSPHSLLQGGGGAHATCVQGGPGGNTGRRGRTGSGRGCRAAGPVTSPVTQFPGNLPSEQDPLPAREGPGPEGHRASAAKEACTAVSACFQSRQPGGWGEEDPPGLQSRARASGLQAAPHAGDQRAFALVEGTSLEPSPMCPTVCTQQPLSGHLEATTSPGVSTPSRACCLHCTGCPLPSRKPEHKQANRRSSPGMTRSLLPLHLRAPDRMTGPCPQPWRHDPDGQDLISDHPTAN